jgi:hypothetical protein
MKKLATMPQHFVLCRLIEVKGGSVRNDWLVHFFIGTFWKRNPNHLKAFDAIPAPSKKRKRVQQNFQHLVCWAKKACFKQPKAFQWAIAKYGSFLNSFRTCSFLCRYFSWHVSDLCGIYYLLNSYSLPVWIYRSSLVLFWYPHLLLMQITNQ